MSGNPVLIVPACKEGRGGGHLNRSVFLQKRLLELGRQAYLFIPENRKSAVVSRFSVDASLIHSKREELSLHTWGLIILDNFRTSEEEFYFWADIKLQRHSPREQPALIGIDEGGPCRNSFDFLIDLLPALPSREPNLIAPFLLPLPINRRPPVINTGPLRILISFGAEDSAGLGLSVARALYAIISNIESPPAITLVMPALSREEITKLQQELPGIIICGLIPDLKERLAEYDLLITHFGLSAFEAVYARVPVLLFSPTPYHEKLARNAGFFSAVMKGIKKRSPHGGTGCGKSILANSSRRDAEAQRTRLRTAGSKRLCANFFPDNDFLTMLNHRSAEIALRYGLEDDQKEDLGAYIAGLSPQTPGVCPLCGKKSNALKVLARFSEDTYCRCRHCGIIYICRLKTAPIEYEKEYFFDFYKKQYGKTYLEDFPNLMEMGRKRLANIQTLLIKSSTPPHRRVPTEGSNHPAKPSLLDIGCAYGPFLAAAAEMGFLVAGVEPAEDAVRYITEELKVPAWHGFFPDALPDEENRPARFDVITLWYVIEHFEEPGKILREIHRLLKEGGILAFSTPSFSGISGRKSLRTFLKHSPSDHWTVWSPALCKKLFPQYGFRLCKIAVTGHHPERFPLLGRFIKPSGKGLLYRVLFYISRLLRLGDTFEVYGVKTGAKGVRQHA